MRFLWILLNKYTFSGCFLSKFLFELSSVISKVLVAEFVCWGRYWVTIAGPRIIKKPYPANKSLLKVNNRNPKTRCEICYSRDCVSLLTTCNMSKTFFQVFFCCTMNMSLPCSFWMSLLSILKRFHMP